MIDDDLAGPTGSPTDSSERGGVKSLYANDYTDYYTVSNLTFGYGDNPVLSGVSFNLERGKIYGVIGPSGGGKSTLLKLIGGLLSPDSGRVSCPSCTHGFMFQEGALFDSMSVLDNVGFPLVAGRVPVAKLPYPLNEEVTQAVLQILERVGLRSAWQKVPAQLSGGMRRRVALARALVAAPGLALLDDPTSGLDPVASRVIMDLVQELHNEPLGQQRPVKKEGREESTRQPENSVLAANEVSYVSKRTTFVASHDLRRLFPIVDEVLALFNGTLAFQGTVEELLVSAPEDVRYFVSCRYRKWDEGKDV